MTVLTTLVILKMFRDPRYRVLSRKEMKLFERDRDRGRKIEF
jgi:hypothetical protein